jgi:hypothetical protein
VFRVPSTFIPSVSSKDGIVVKSVVNKNRVEYRMPRESSAPRSSKDAILNLSDRVKLDDSSSAIRQERVSSKEQYDHSHVEKLSANINESDASRRAQSRSPSPSKHAFKTLRTFSSTLAAQNSVMEAESRAVKYGNLQTQVIVDNE